MTLKDEFENTLERGTTFNDGDYVKWLLIQLANAEFAMGDTHADLVLRERYSVNLKRSKEIRAAILSFFPDPVVN